MRPIPPRRCPAGRAPARFAARLAIVACGALGALTSCDRPPTETDAAGAPPLLEVAGGRTTGVAVREITGMNDRGDVVGLVGTRAYRWTRDGGVQELVGLGERTLVYALNNTGFAVGASGPASVFQSRAMIWMPGGAAREIVVPNAEYSYAVAINEGGMVAGTAYITGVGLRAFRWTFSGGVELLPPAGTSDRAIGLNSAGDVIGEAFVDARVHYDVALWPASGGVRVLPHLGDFDNRALDINDQGWIVGYASDPGWIWRAVLWMPDGSIHKIGPPTGEFSHAMAVNEAGMVLINAESGGVIHPYQWTQAGGLRDIDGLGSSFSEGYTMNEAGDVAGVIHHGNGRQSGYVWSEALGMQELAPLQGFTDTRALFVNNAGDVAGVSLTSTSGRVTVWSDIVKNGPPLAHAGGPYPGRISGRRYAYSAAASSDPDGDPLRYYWNMNGAGADEGSTVTPLFNYTYPAGGSYTLRLVVVDDDGRRDTATATVTVAQNVAPLGGISGVPASAAEGSRITLVAAATDDNQATDTTELGLLRYHWDWGDGYTSSARSSTHAYADQGSFSVRMIVTDAGGMADTVVGTAVIGNVAPTGRLAAPASIREGVPYTLTASALRDVPADVAKGLEVAFNCGGGFGAYGTALSIVCPARPDQGSVTVRMRVRDKDGAASEAVRTVPVGNVAPAVTASATTPTTFAAGGSLSVSATFTDVAADAPYRYRIYWGDGTSTPLASVAAGAAITGKHTYAAAGSYSVQVAVADKDGGSGRSAQIAVTVTP
jgi:PKD repeat protein